MIDKNKMENGVYYFGTCRNTKFAMWLDNEFIFLNLQFNRPYVEHIKHYQDVKDLNSDGFIPIRRLDYDYDEIKRAKITEDYNMSARKIYRNLNIKNLRDEVWCDIQGYETIYQVSNYGRVRKNDIKILKQNFSREYLILGLTDHNGKRTTFRVHRLVAMAFKLDGYVKGYEVNHINGIKTDNRDTNLEWIKHSENSKHMYTSGNVCKKLTPDLVVEIKKMLFEGCVQKEIAKKYNVSRSTISEINTNKKWKNIKIMKHI